MLKAGNTIRSSLQEASSLRTQSTSETLPSDNSAGGTVDSNPGSNLERIHFENYLSAILGGETGDENANDIFTSAIRLPRKKRTRGTIKQIAEIPDHNPAVALDAKENIYLVWEHGNELWWAVNKEGNWIRGGKIPGDGGTRPVLIYGPQFIDQNMVTDQGISQDGATSQGVGKETPGNLFCAWETLTTPTKIMGSTGTLTESGITWSEPQAITGDDNNDYGIAMAADSNHHPLILWLQRASLDDDADLYYQTITSPGQTLASTSSVQTLASPVSQLTGLVSKLNEDHVTDPSSNWVAQGDEGVPEDPLVIVDPTSPQVTANCVEITLLRLGIERPRIIPFIGESVSFELSDFICGNSGVRPVQNPSFLTPLALNELAAEVTLGAHTAIGFTLFSLGQVAIHTNPSEEQSPIEQIITTYGGGTSFVYLYHPVPVSACGTKLGMFRIGPSVSAGLSASYIKRPNNPKLPYELLIYLILELGPEAVFNSLGNRFEAVGAVEGASEFYLSLTNDPPVIIQARAIHMTGAVSVGDGLIALVARFHKDYSLSESSRTIDPNSLPKFINQGFKKWSDPNSLQNTLNNFNFTPKPLMVQSQKDKLTKTISYLMGEGNTLVDEMLEWVKKPLIGTGSIYEGKPVLNDISSDIYNDGVPSVAKSEPGEIMAIWTKALADSKLGTKIYTAIYTGEGWTSPVEITPRIDFHKDPSVVFDSHGKPMAVWSSASIEGLSYEESSIEEILKSIDQTDILYSQRIEGKWTVPKIIARIPGSDEQVNLAAGPDGEITAVWINQSVKGSFLYGSLWNGERWAEPVSIAKAALAEAPVVIYKGKMPSAIWAQDKDGQVNTSYDWGLYLSSWDGTSWQSQPLSLAEQKTLDEQKTHDKQTILGERKILTKLQTRADEQKAKYEKLPQSGRRKRFLSTEENTR